MKPIETVYIEAAGDPSVGIPRSSFTATLFLDPNCFADPDKAIEDIRNQFIELYSELCDERVAVMFDFELEAREKLMDAMTQEAP